MLGEIPGRPALNDSPAVYRNNYVCPSHAGWFKISTTPLPCPSMQPLLLSETLIISDIWQRSSFSLFFFILIVFSYSLLNMHFS